MEVTNLCVFKKEIWRYVIVHHLFLFRQAKHASLKCSGFLGTRRRLAFSLLARSKKVGTENAR